MDTAEKIWSVLMRLMPDIIAWVRNLLDDGLDPESIEEIVRKTMKKVEENRAEVDDLIDQKFGDE